MYTPFILLFAVSTALADAPESDPVAPARGPWFVSSSVFMLGNFPVSYTHLTLPTTPYV